MYARRDENGGISRVSSAVICDGGFYGLHAVIDCEKPKEERDFERGNGLGEDGLEDRDLDGIRWKYENGVNKRPKAVKGPLRSCWRRILV